MQNKFVEDFFGLLRAGLWEKEVELRNYGATDYSEIMRLATEQSVVGLVAAGIEKVQGLASPTIDATRQSSSELGSALAAPKVHDSKFKVPQEWALQFIGQTLQIEQQNKAMNAFIAGLIEKLRKDDIYALLVKGQGVAQCYEKPLWRSSGDVDLFLSADNYEKAKAVLTPIASSVEEEYKKAKHLGMTIDGWIVELHGTLQCNLSRRVKRGIDEIENEIIYGGQVRSWQNGRVQVFLPSASNDAIYIFAHFLNHFYKEGVGLRQICDWCRLMWTYRDSLNYGLIEQRIKRMGLVSEWKAFYNLASRYLGMPDLDSSFMFQDSRFDKKADWIMEAVLKNGGVEKNLRKAFCLFPASTLRFLPGLVFNVNWLKMKERLVRG